MTTPNKLLMHELLDRTHLLQDMFNSYIVDHPASELFEKDIEEISQLLGCLYQKIGSVS